MYIQRSILLTCVLSLHVAMAYALVIQSRPPQALNTQDRVSVSLSTSFRSQDTPPEAESTPREPTPIHTPSPTPPRPRQNPAPSSAPLPTSTEVAPSNYAIESEISGDTNVEQVATNGIDSSFDSVETPSIPDHTPPDAYASHLRNPTPPYPETSLENNEEGTVILNVYILHTGQVGDINVQKSSGFFRLDESALNTVKRWIFVPASQQGVPVSGWHQQRINFKLQ